MAALEPSQRHGGSTAEATVDRARPEPVAAEPELEHGHVPADGPDTELALAEQRTPARAEGASRPPVDPPVRLQALLALERGEGLARQRPGDPVDGPWGESVSPQRNLDRGDARVRARSVVHGEAADDEGQR